MAEGLAALSTQPLLEKPFTPDALLAAARAALDAAARPALEEAGPAFQG